MAWTSRREPGSGSKAAPRVRRSKASPSRWARMAWAAGWVSRIDPERPRLEGQVERLAVAPDGDGDARRLGIAGLDLLLEVVAGRQLGPGVAEQDVARLDAGLLGVRAGLDLLDQQAVIGRLGGRFVGRAEAPGRPGPGGGGAVPDCADPRGGVPGARRTGSPRGHS